MVSEKVKALLNLTGKKQADLAAHMGIAAQSVANKMQRDSWSAKDLANIADFVGGKLSISLPDGQQIYITISGDNKDQSSRIQDIE